MQSKISIIALLSLLFAWAVPSRAADHKPGDNLVVEGLPPIPAELVAELARYQNLRSASFADWLPGRGGMLIQTRFAQTSQIHRLHQAEGMREQLTFFDERVAWTAACPAKNCEFLVFGMDTGGTEKYQLHRLDLTTGRHSQLTPGKGRNMGSVFDPQGKHLAYCSTRRNAKDFDLYLMDPRKPESDRLLLEVKGLHMPLVFSPDGKSLLVLHYISANSSHLYLVDVQSGKTTALDPADEKDVAYKDAKFSKDGKRIYFTSDRKWEFVRLGYVDTASAGKDFEPKWLTSQINWDVEHFDLSSNGRLVAFVTNEDGMSKLHMITPAGKKQKKSPKLPSGVIRGIQFQRDGRKLAISLSGTQTPGDVFVYDPKKKKVRRWTHSETGGLDLSIFAEPELIHFPTFDQDGEGPRQIPAFVYLPPKERFKPPYPVMISIHGGPEGQARPRFLGQAQYRIQELGIALVMPNVRGSSGYGKNYLTLDNGKKRENSVRDIGALLDAIAKREDLDEKRVLVSGGSYGGYMSLASLTYYSDRLLGGIDYVGISSFVTFLENTKAYRQDLRRVEYGDERNSAMRMFLDMISPLNNAEKIKVPLFVIQGANDPRVPASEAEQIVKKLRSKGGKVWYLLAKDEGHGFVKKRNKDFANTAVVMFLKKILLK
ncbi:MAG: S9 family peptidase [Deltaproteobacteria bacterium]|nr:S9 family peptidase [Deltaproteobacteria bacterium]